MQTDLSSVLNTLLCVVGLLIAAGIFIAVKLYKPTASERMGIPVNQEIPKQILELLLPDEEVVFCVQQSRLKSVAFPAAIAITDSRLIALAPSLLKSAVEQWLFVDIQNVVVFTKIAFGDVQIIPRFGDKVIFEGFTKADAKELARQAMAKIHTAMRSSTQPAPAPTSPVVAEDPIQIAKGRFARGEITKDELDEIIAALS